MVGNRMSHGDGKWRLEGALNEHVGYQAILKTPSPWIVDLGAVQSINSLGVRAFVEFISLAQKQRGRVELHNCTMPVLDMLNSIPASLGTPADPSMVRSVLLPFSCGGCGRQEQVKFEMPKLRPGEFPKLPPAVCAKCSSKTHPVLPEEDFFVFLTAED
jgi:hypothetical protein